MWWRDREKELKEEVNSHLEMAARERAERGAGLVEARQAARREFGNVGLVRQTTRDVWGWRWLRDAYEDARFGLRTLGKSIGFTVTAILTLALGIGANTAIFSMIDAALLKSLPVRDAVGLVVPRWSAHKEPKHLSITSYGDCGPVGGPKNPGGCSVSRLFFEEMRRQCDLFSSVAAFAGGNQLDMSANGMAEIVRRSQYVSGDYFQTLGVVPVAGRLINANDDTASAAPVAVLSASYWRSQF